MQPPIYTPEEARTRQTFLALMNALSFPGRIQRLPVGGSAAYIALGETLLDLETSFHTPAAWLMAELANTGARNLAPDRAAYHFYPEGINLNALKVAGIGTLMYPDSGATLIIGAHLETGSAFRLNGPGIPGETIVKIGGIESSVWELRTQVSRYPLGWDIFLVDDDRVLGLPRTTQINPERQEA